MADKNLVAPDRLAIPIASEGDYNIIPTNSQDKASLEQGFPVKTSIPFNQGGDPVSRNDMNGFLNLLSKHLYWYQSGGQAIYSNQNNYIPNNIVLHNNNWWICRAANGLQNGGIIAPGANTNYWQTLQEGLGLASTANLNNSISGLVREVTASGNTIRVTKQNGSVSSYTIQSGNWTLYAQSNGWIRNDSTGFTFQWGQWDGHAPGPDTVYFPRTFSWCMGITTQNLTSAQNPYKNFFTVYTLNNSGFQGRVDDVNVRQNYLAWGLT